MKTLSAELKYRLQNPNWFRQRILLVAAELERLHGPFFAAAFLEEHDRKARFNGAPEPLGNPP